MRHVIITLLVLFMSCTYVTNPEVTSKECGTESPYSLYDVTTDNTTKFVPIRFVYIRKNKECFHTDIDREHAGIDLLNKEFNAGKIEFIHLKSIYWEPKDLYTPLGFKQHSKDVEAFEYFNNEGYGMSMNIFIYEDNTNFNAGKAASIPAVSAYVQYSYMTGPTLVHEVGHCFGLRHTHAPDPTDGRNYDYGDYICDIPSIEEMKIYNKVIPDCKNIKNINSEDGYSDEEIQTLVENWMSYTLLECRKSFTTDQINLMRKTITTDPIFRRMTER